jgi:hypothetical protein
MDEEEDLNYSTTKVNSRTTSSINSNLANQNQSNQANFISILWKFRQQLFAILTPILLSPLMYSGVTVSHPNPLSYLVIFILNKGIQMRILRCHNGHLLDTRRHLKIPDI